MIRWRRRSAAGCGVPQIGARLQRRRSRRVIGEAATSDRLPVKRGAGGDETTTAGRPQDLGAADKEDTTGTQGGGEAPVEEVFRLLLEIDDHVAAKNQVAPRRKG